MMGGGYHRGQIHSAYHGLLTYCSALGLYQSLYTRGGEPGPYSFEAARGIAIEGRSYWRDRYVGIGCG